MTGAWGPLGVGCAVGGRLWDPRGDNFCHQGGHHPHPQEVLRAGCVLSRARRWVPPSILNFFVLFSGQNSKCQNLKHFRVFRGSPSEGKSLTRKGIHKFFCPVPSGSYAQNQNLGSLVALLPKLDHCDHPLHCLMQLVGPRGSHLLQ